MHDEADATQVELGSRGTAGKFQPRVTLMVVSSPEYQIFAEVCARLAWKPTHGAVCELGRSLADLRVAAICSANSNVPMMLA